MIAGILKDVNTRLFPYAVQILSAVAVSFSEVAFGGTPFSGAASTCLLLAACANMAVAVKARSDMLKSGGTSFSRRSRCCILGINLLFAACTAGWAASHIYNIILLGWG